MKINTVINICFMSILFLSGRDCHADDQPQRLRRYQVPSGIVEYDIKGDGEGKEVLFFDHWGMREARYRHSVHPRLGAQNIVTLSNNQDIRIIDTDKKIGQEKKDTFLEKIMAGLPEIAEPVEFSELQMEQMGGVKIGTEMVADKICDVWEVKDSRARFWLWKGIPLKMQTVIDGVPVVIEAVRIQEGGPVPEEKFVIPQDIFFLQEDINQIFLSRTIKSTGAQENMRT